MRVHYNSARPAQLQAHAFAQGSDIHVAPGQEQHLPHEAWHVVQQKQGRVRATHQFKGAVPLNDDVGLEKEADMMGRQAVQRYTAIRTQPLNASGSTSATVLQRVATQIITHENKENIPIIAQVVVRGRPISVYANSMGDHTTAFIVHVEGLNVNMTGLTVPQAVQYMVGLAAHLRELPGYQIMQLNGPNGRVIALYTAAETTLQHCLQGAENTQNPHVQMHYLQEAIDAYLDARELIPFSTINIGEKSKGKAGRGHGESGPAGVLSSAEQALKNKQGAERIEHKNVVAAVYGLFDFQSAGMAAAEVNETRLLLMTQGITFQAQQNNDSSPVPVTNPLQRLQLIWRQHCLTIARLYPLTYAQVKGDLNENYLKLAMEKSVDQDFIYLIDDANRYLDLLEREFRNLLNDFGSKGLESGNKIVLDRAKRLNAMYANQARLLDVIREMHALNNIMGRKFSEQIRQYETKVKEYSTLDSKLPHFDVLRNQNAMSNTIREQIEKAEKGRSKFEGSVNPGAAKNLGELGSAITGRPIAHFREQIEDPEDESEVETDEIMEEMPDHKVNSSGTETLSSRMHSMAIQVTLDAHGAITGMLSAGRPSSPFKGTMGAHSTAWAAHLDRVRATIRGLSIPVAYAALQHLAGRVTTLYTLQQKKTPGNNAKGLLAGAHRQMNTLKNVVPTKASLVLLQQFIEAILSFYNLIPEVSRDRLDTTGKGEGTYRARLLAFEATGVGSQESIREAVVGMFDGRGRQGVIWENHLQVIGEAYPHSYALVYENKAHSGPKSQASVAVPSRENDDDSAMMEPLNKSQIEETTAAAQDRDWLLSLNNCLINAIAEAGGHSLPLPAQVIVDIRAEIGAELGTMLAATTPVLNIIARHLNLPNGVVVVYHGSRYTDETTEVRGNGQHPVYIFHDGVNHFRPLR
ncbi:eCIS core domain-containing protein [Hymenobacter pini]|uniref:eCIS core domain-containing protein n=1 Tax=Hymenobacter pini TaxID=2880879 RepID=UPI003742F2BA